MVFVVGQVLGLAVDGGAGAKYECVDLRGLHGLEQADAALHVVGVVVDGFFCRFAYGFEASKVDDSLYAVLAQGGFEQGCVADVALHKGQALACDALQAVGYGDGAVAQVVKQYDLVACLGKYGGGVAADVACAACEEDVHCGVLCGLG